MTHAPKHPESLSRRDMIAATAAALVTPLLQGGAVSMQPVAGVPGKFLTAAEYALLDELTELIIPADDHSPGARDRKSTRLNSSHLVISYAVFCLKKKIT